MLFSEGAKWVGVCLLFEQNIASYIAGIVFYVTVIITEFFIPCSLTFSTFDFTAGQAGNTDIINFRGQWFGCESDQANFTALCNS